MNTTGPVRYVLTAHASAHRLSEQAPLPLAAGDGSLPQVIVDPARTFQTIEGFGGAFTEAAAVNLGKLPPARRDEFLRAYFDRSAGHGYSLCRTHMNSCDFSVDNYAHAAVPGDTALKHFSIARDRQALLPMIQEAQRVAGEKLKIVASPWSPPAWMKTNGEMNHGGRLKPEYRDAWARCFVRFIQSYEDEGVTIWGVTVQNEPYAAQTWDSCLFRPEEERDFVRDFLGPQLERAGLGRVRIIIWDHNRDFMVERAQVVFSDPAAARFVWGTGFHWYGDDKFDNVQLVHDAWPEKQLLFTEGCQEGGPHIGSWDLGERYARSIINDLNRWTVGWMDWNLLLDERGGPNHVGNFCSAPILADTARGELMLQSSYYYLGHFSRFIRPGARRILCASTRSDIESTAFLNPDGAVATVALNRTSQPLSFAVRFPWGSATASLPPRSIATLVSGGG